MVRKPDIGGVQLRARSWRSPLFRTLDIARFQEEASLGNPVTLVKFLCVLVLMLNGLNTAPAMHQMLALPPQTRFGEIGRRLRNRLLIALTISQACWWTAVLIGLVNSTLRRWAGT
jgi:hypothetical protein